MADLMNEIAVLLIVVLIAGAAIAAFVWLAS